MSPDAIKQRGVGCIIGLEKRGDGGVCLSETQRSKPGHRAIALSVCSSQCVYRRGRVRVTGWRDNDERVKGDGRINTAVLSVSTPSCLLLRKQGMRGSKSAEDELRKDGSGSGMGRRLFV